MSIGFRRNLLMMLTITMHRFWMRACKILLTMWWRERSAYVLHCHMCEKEQCEGKLKKNEWLNKPCDINAKPVTMEKKERKSNIQAWISIQTCTVHTHHPKSYESDTPIFNRFSNSQRIQYIYDCYILFCIIRNGNCNDTKEKKLYFVLMLKLIVYTKPWISKI